MVIQMLIFSIQNHKVSEKGGATETTPLVEGNWQLMAVGGGCHFRVTFSVRVWATDRLPMPHWMA